MTVNAGSDPATLLAGSPAAQLVLREVAADPTAHARIVVVGPGGYGKTVLLDALATVWSDAGVPVRRSVQRYPMTRAVQRPRTDFFVRQRVWAITNRRPVAHDACWTVSDRKKPRPG